MWRCRGAVESTPACSWGEASPDIKPLNQWSVTPNLAARLRSRPVELWDRSELKLAQDALTTFRGVYVGPLFSLEPRWFEGELPVEELGAVQVIKLDAFTKIAPSRRLSDLVMSVDAGVVPPNDTFGVGYPILRHSFDPTKTRGRPIVVAEREVGPYLEVEGLTRLAVQQSLAMAGRPAQPLIPLILGITPRLSSWRFA